jgi:hypothetical protein
MNLNNSNLIQNILELQKMDIIFSIINLNLKEMSERCSLPHNAKSIEYLNFFLLFLFLSPKLF